MGRQQFRLLVCSATAIALLAGSLLAIPWFRIDLLGSAIEIDLQSASACNAQHMCMTVPLSKLSGLYPATATVSFYAGLLLLLVVIVQSASKIVTGAAHDSVTRIGYVLAVATLVCGVSAGYFFGPDGTGLSTALASVKVERTLAPLAFLVGNLAAFGVLFYASADLTEEVAEYKPIQIDKRLPVTPLTNKVVTRGSGSIPLEGSTRTARPPTQPPVTGGRPITPSGGLRTEDLRSKSPSSPPGRTMTPSGGSRSLTPGGGFARVDTTPTSGFARDATTPGGGFVRIDETRTRPPTQPPHDTRTRPPTQPPHDTRTRPPTQPPVVARTTSPSSIADPSRTKTSSQPPFVARTTSPMGIADPARTKTSSQPPIDLVARARTSSSGPIDLAARLSASVPNPLDGAPNLAVSIRPPLPTPEPVPPDQIPVDPAAGLTIRKRTASASPQSELTLAPIIGTPVTPPGGEMALAPAPSDRAFEPPIAIPTPPESGLLIRQRRPSAAPPNEKASGDGMPGITIDGLEKLAEALTSAAQIAEPRPEAKVVELPDYIRGKLKFAVLTAELASVGIKARREDGFEKVVAWDEIVGIVARRLPAEKPFGGATVVDLLSTAGATLRIVPWTKLDGHPFESKAVERARSFVNVVAAMALDAKLDAATKAFANGDGDAAQLPSVAALATHDSKVG